MYENRAIATYHVNGGSMSKKRKQYIPKLIHFLLSIPSRLQGPHSCVLSALGYQIIVGAVLRSAALP